VKCPSVRLLLVAACLAAGGCQPPAKAPDELKLTLLSEKGIDIEVLRLAKKDHLALLKRSLADYRARTVKGQTCTFVKQERIDGKLGKVQHIAVKFTPSPFRLAMRWTKNPPLADALVYVEGRYRDKDGRSRMAVRPTGLLAIAGTQLRLPDGEDAMKNTLRPCTQFGFENSLTSLIETYESARRAGQCEENYGGVADIHGRPCAILLRTLPDGKDYPAKKTFTFLDVETLLPMRVVGYDWDDRLLCDYEVRDLVFTAEIGEADFTLPANGIKPPKE
jgi:hypothetical protein